MDKEYLKYIECTDISYMYKNDYNNITIIIIRGMIS